MLDLLGYFDYRHDGTDIAGSVNVGWANWNPFSPQDTIAKIRSQVALGIPNIVLHINYVVGGGPIEFSGERWGVMDRALTEANLWPSIRAFYHYDEPFSAAVNQGRSKTDVATELRGINAILAGFKPHVHRLGCFAWTELVASHASEMPGSSADAYGYTVVSTACYSPTASRPQDYRALHAELKRRFPTQELMLMADGYLEDGDTEASELARIRLQVEIAKTDPRVHGLLIYLWDHPTWDKQTVKNVPWMRAHYRELGRSILGRQT